jgi:putative DNA primase/helicase
MWDELYFRARGKWAQIFMGVGVGHRFLNPRKNGPCPMCGGKDRWRFTNHDDRGGWVCNSCGRGYGLDFLMTYKGVTLGEAVKLVESVIGGPGIHRKRTDADDTTRLANRKRELWGRACRLDGSDIGSRYLNGRAIALEAYPAALRWVGGLPYWPRGEGQPLGHYKALLARFISPDDSASTLQRLFLEEPWVKAKMETPRMTMPGPIPRGGAVRLAPAAEEMGVAEGVESALAASILFGMPVWAALSANGVRTFEPPKLCCKLWVYADHDDHRVGEAVAEMLLHRMRQTNKIACEIKEPIPPWPGKFDWNDALIHRELQRLGGGLARRLLLEEASAR